MNGLHNFITCINKGFLNVSCLQSSRPALRLCLFNQNTQGTPKFSLAGSDQWPVDTIAQFNVGATVSDLAERLLTN